jgi:hypothetical protein
MKQAAIIVDNLMVKSVSGSTPYPNENGFSSISASVTAKHQELETELTKLKERKEAVTLRCARLQVTGQISNIRIIDGKKNFVILIDDLEYLKPSTT